MKLYIRNMVCNRCIAVVKSEFDTLGYSTANVTMGEVDLPAKISSEALKEISSKLTPHGFELIDDKKSKLIEKIKTVVISQVHNGEDKPKQNYSDLIAQKLNKDYSYLSNLFSEIEGITIEHYIILQKIERVKELLVYDELSLNEIADEMGYSSASHLSNQFKKVTGLTPSYFKTVKDKKRLSLDHVKSKKDV